MEVSSPNSPPLMIFATLPKSNTTNIEVSDPNHYQLPKRQISPSEVLEEIKQLFSIAFPMILTGLLLYGKSTISMLFMGKLGKETLAGASLSIGFANITGYSILSGLASGMEPISSQAFGAKRWPLIGYALQRTIAVLLAASIPISFLWLYSQPILLLCGQDPSIAAIASTYLTYSLPTLFLQSFINPLKIYLRSQKITLPLTSAAIVALILHAPINYFFVYKLGLGIRGIAISSFASDLNFLFVVLVHLHLTGLHRKSWPGWSLSECFSLWWPLLNLAIPSCAAVCLEWWWYEFMIVFSGLLDDATDAVATMGILIQTTSLVYIFPSALSLAVSTRVGNELGSGQPDRARASMIVALSCAAITGFGAMAFTMSVRHVWGQAFTADKAVVSLTAMAMPVVGLCELGNCPQTTGCGVLRGSARPTLGANINLGAFYGVGMPVAMVMGFMVDMGLMGLWLGLAVAQGTCALLMVFVLMRTDWVVEARRARELTRGGDGNQVAGLEEETEEAKEGIGNSSPLGKRREERNEAEPLISIKLSE